jgi:peptidyl-prolyl cis-trans isomerase C
MPHNPLKFALAALLITGSAAAQSPTPPADPVVARVDGTDIHLSDISDAARSLPDTQGMPPQVLFPMILDRLISTDAVAEAARKQGIDKDPTVQHQIARATDQVLTNTLFTREVGPTITEDAIKAAYDQDYAGKGGEEEIHARHILVASEAEAKNIIAQLKAGGDFAKLAAQYSTEPGAGARGGDLGFFKKGDMVPEFANAAFAMKPGQTSTAPVHTQFGWHVIKVEEVKTDPAPTLEQVHDEIRTKLIQAGVKKVVDQAMAQATIQRFNMDGTTPKATDLAEPPPK